MEEEVSGGQQRPDKKGIFGEVFSEAQLASFLDGEPFGNYSKDFSILLRAYRSLPVEAFEDFIPLFLQRGFNLKTTTPEGVTFLDYIQPNLAQSGYVQVLRRFLSGDVN